MHFRSLAAACTLLAATAALGDSPVNFVYRDAGGNVHDFHFDGKAWQTRQLNHGGMTTAPLATSDPSAFEVVRPSILSYTALPVGRRDYTYLGANGDIHHLYYQDGQWAHDTLNNAGVTSAPPAVGRVAGLPFDRKAFTYTFRDQDGNLQNVVAQDGWRAYRLNNGGKTSAPAAAGDPSALQWGTGNLGITYRDPAGGVQHIRWEQGVWQTEQLNRGGATEAPAAAGDPGTLLGGDQTLHCAYRDLTGNLHHLYRDQATWHHEQINNGGATTAPLAASDPAGTALPSGQVHFVYRDQAGGLQHLFQKEGQWGNEKLADGDLNAPAAVSGPWVSPGPGPEVFYLDGQNNLQHLFIVQGQWHREVVNAGAHVTMAPPAGRLHFY